MEDRPTIVVGAGVAGISASIHISAILGRQQSLISCHLPGEPSKDRSKIVRGDYDNFERMEAALAAQSAWQVGSFARFYFPRGRLVAYDEDSLHTLAGIQHNRLQLGLKPRQLGGKKLFEEYFGPATANCLRTSTIVHNTDDAIIDWRPCIEEHEDKARQLCLQSGGSVYDQAVETLVHEEKRVTALILKDGCHIDTKDTDIILAIGPWTVEVLERSGIDLPPEGRVPTATGLFAFEIQLNETQIELFKNKPVFSHIGRAEFLPPVAENDHAKITWVEPFTIKPIRDVSDHAVARRVLEKVLDWARDVLPALKGAEVIKTHFYCDGVTATQAPIKARHPVLENLYLDCGGSYTSAKDLPTGGAHIARLLKGEKVPDRFSWKGSASTQKDQPHLVAKVDFKSLEEQALRDPGNGSSSSVLAVI